MSITLDEILWIKMMAANWAKASIRTRAELKREWGDKFVEILELINIAHDGKPNYQIAANALKAWTLRNRGR